MEDDPNWPTSEDLVQNDWELTDRSHCPWRHPSRTVFFTEYEAAFITQRWLKQGHRD